ncbi:DUF6332 family protein [Streptomyces sp. NPDC101733]|uniref:DUF6332 family protein n=1 Tax=unclassified Streptomyces TaxID=2593676 RepID=UPI00380A7A6D
MVTARSRAERDEATVEISYAFVSAGGAALLVFAVVYGVARGLGLPPSAHRTLIVVGGCLAAAAFVLRASRVLWRHRRRAGD